MNLVAQDNRALQGYQDPKVKEDFLDLVVPEASLDQVALKDQKDLKDRLVNEEKLDLQVLVEHLEQLDLLVHWVQLAQVVH